MTVKCVSKTKNSQLLFRKIASIDSESNNKHRKMHCF